MFNFFKTKPKETIAYEGYLYEKIPVEGRTKILMAGNKPTSFPNYYKKNEGADSMYLIGNYTEIDHSKMNKEDNDIENPEITKEKILQYNKYALTTGYIFAKSNYLNAMVKKRQMKSRHLDHYLTQIEETEPNLYKEIGEDPNYKPPPSQDSTTQSYEPSHNDHNGNPLWGGRKHRRNSKKRNTKRRNSKKRRSHKRR